MAAGSPPPQQGGGLFDYIMQALQGMQQAPGTIDMGEEDPLLMLLRLLQQPLPESQTPGFTNFNQRQQLEQLE